MSKKYKVSIIEFDGEGESLKASALYEQTIPTLDIRDIIAAVNKEPVNPVVSVTPTPKRKRAPRSDKGQRRLKFVQTAEAPE